MTTHLPLVTLAPPLAPPRRERPESAKLLELTPYGPILSGRRAPKRTLAPGTLVPLLSTRDRRIVGGLTALWVVAFVWFWVWWLSPEHRLGTFGFVVNSILLFYLSYMSSYFLVMVNRMKGVNPDLPVPALRTAFVVTKAPSEPWPVARRTLEAMLRQDFPHPYDVWLCDERPSAQTERWCAEHGVRLSSRFGVQDYHRAEYPRRTRCKEGNLSYFYDHWGYRDYDVVAQLDCDHVPAASYLAEMVRPFADPAVGYVAAPSMNDSNKSISWSNRGRLQKEATFHGPSQAGHNGGLAPSCIGSHYAVRTSAVRGIGGVGPELAEDFSTSFLIASAGWEGVFNHRAEAHGDGPITFAAMLTQEYQWSRSMSMIAMNTAPSHLRRFGWGLRLRFLFALSFYPVLAITIAFGLLMPTIAAVTGHNWVSVNYFAFLAHWLVVPCCLLLIVLLLGRRRLLRPWASPVLGWENYLYTLAKWPYIGFGVLAALRHKLFSTTMQPFKVTPKGGNGIESLPTRVMAPYLVITLVTASAALVAGFGTAANGYAFLCLLASTSYAMVSIAVPLLHAREAGRLAGVGFAAAWRSTAWLPTVAGVLAALPLLVALVHLPFYLAPILGQLNQLGVPTP